MGLSLLLSGCVEPFQPDLEGDDTESLLVVEGLITDQSGPFRIRLSSTIPVYDHWSVVDYFVPVSGALVQISDDAGNAYMLLEIESGWYETEEKDLKGIPGNTYFLSVTTPDGLEYESDAVLIIMTKPFVAILMGSDSDWPVMQSTVAVLQSLDVPLEVRVTSAHRTPDATHAYVKDAEARGCAVFVAAAGLRHRSRPIGTNLFNKDQVVVAFLCDRSRLADIIL